ncbi:MAG: hypothetical protein DSM106950_13640 [Stigonema ocellatum SAG 48.90 = DSM 106950]|nr:hypothetical protein [Stigonema ocellatum SAG 48.90 = DSM 106950]
MAKILTPVDLLDTFVTLQALGLDAVVVGGQAVNLWAYQYQIRCPKLQEFLPFASEDLDFYGGRVEAIACNDALKGRVTLNKDFDPSPNSGVVIVNRQDSILRIDFLATVYGLNDAEISGTALTFVGESELAGLNLKVLHPVLCLEGKLKCLRGLPQQGRQDIKHVKMSILCLNELIKDLSTDQEARSILKLVERVLESALREDGLSAWYRHQILLESAIPFDTLCEINNEKYQRFCQIRLPQVIEHISVKRQQYLSVMSRIEARSQDTE